MSDYNAPFEIHVHGDVKLRADVKFAQIQEALKPLWKYAGAKEQAVRELFEMSATRYYQVLNALIDSPAALAYDPMLIKRLRRMRTTRQRARTARRLGIDG